MTCEHCIEMISANLDCELTDAEVSELEDHLANCPCCRSVQDRMKCQAAEMAGQSVPPMPERLRVNIGRELSLEQSNPAHSWYVGDPHRMPPVSKKTNTTLVMGPWGRAT